MMKILISRAKKVVLMVSMLMMLCGNQQMVGADSCCPCAASCILILSQLGTTSSTGAVGYGYIYNLTAQSVGTDDPILFDSNGPLSGVTHVAGSSNIVVTNAGVYAVLFSVSGTEPNQFTIWVNGVSQPSTRYGSGAGSQQNDGLSILTLPAGAVITIVNDDSSSPSVDLSTPIGGTGANVNASVLIVRLS
jgi:hypothetical protein